MRLPGFGIGDFRDWKVSAPADLASDRLYRLVCVFPRRGDLGIHQRGVPKSGKGKRPKPRQSGSLARDGVAIWTFPDACRSFGGCAVRVLFGHDGAPVLCSLIAFPETKGITLEDMQRKLGIA
jgi:hypothetical protein